MDKIRIELNRDAVRNMLRSSEMQSICREHAERIASNAGDGYNVDTYVGKNRCNAQVSTVTDEAYRDNLQNNTLLRGLQ